MPTFDVAPAQLPLPGGSEGASVVLHPLLCAEMSGPSAWFERVSGPTAALKALGIGVPAEQNVTIPIVAFLVEHPSAGRILIDTGFHSVVATGPKQQRSRNLGLTGRVMGRGIQMEPEQAIASQLKTRGIDAGDVRLIVMTHLHFDHASGLPEFPAATVLVTEPEWRAARRRGSQLGGYCEAQLDPRQSYRTVDFDAPGASPQSSFAQTLDLFGDGSIVLAFTPGHSKGHMSLILRLSSCEALIAGDAIYTMATLRGDARPWRVEDSRAFERSLTALKDYDRANPDAVIIPGHDMEHWRQLETRYS